MNKKFSVDSHEYLFQDRWLPIQDGTIHYFQHKSSGGRRTVPGSHLKK